MFKKLYIIRHLEKEDAELINHIVVKSRNGFRIWTYSEFIGGDGNYIEGMVFKFGDANGSSENLTKELNDALLDEVEKEFKEIKEYYEIKEYS
ncbi:hypothetical protein [Methanobrevibacter thaueri]|uniref:Uncharacterized protein n=1 Tax=Methanobrevibacter thaueri TaxID=190975 RepID=A0A315YBP0_9EURY|nr:hypothetical protein [Methanobrevibacter thaueri]PWB88032.1 hypothetical protein MBBTH_01740 [Methanobrevibacter thaueri]